MKKTRSVTVNSKSIDSTIPKVSFWESLSEYIWNAFDARASQIEIIYEKNELKGIDKLSVKDNGYGIIYEDLNKTFDPFLDSPKKNSIRSSYIRGKKGKGRFYFTNFSTKAVWDTIYRKQEEYYSYSITINDSSKNNHTESTVKISKKNKTGTIVTFTGLHMSEFTLELNTLEKDLAKEFGWFLLLNKGNNYRLLMNGKEITYENLIESSVSYDEKFENHIFTINYVQWKDKIGEKYYYYFLNNEKREIEKKLTSFNNNGINFHHSVYIESDLFEHYNFDSKQKELTLKKPVQINLNKQEDLLAFKELSVYLNHLLSEKQKEFIKFKGANILIENFTKKNLFPKFKANKYDQERKADLINVVKEIYSIQPKIFERLKEEQAKTILGFLNLLLDSEERDQILDIMEEVISLNENQRTELSNILKHTKLTKIIDTIRLLKNRLGTVEILKKLIYDLEAFTNEREHVQKAIERNYWLFGEQFHLVSADENFEKLLSNYLHILDGELGKQKINNPNKNKRPDIFLCSKHDVPDSGSNEYVIEENILVELKRPSITIGKTQFDQVEGYLRFIIKEPKLNSELRKWKFFIVGKDIDEYILDKYESQKNKGKKFLIEQVKNYEIYAIKWDDLFKTFEIKHKYLFDKLNLDKLTLEQELGITELNFSKVYSDNLTNKIVNINEHDNKNKIMNKK